MALAWALRDERVTSLVVGASSAGQLADSLAALEHLSFTDEELRSIDDFAQEGGIDLWRQSATS